MKCVKITCKMKGEKASRNTLFQEFVITQNQSTDQEKELKVDSI